MSLADHSHSRLTPNCVSVFSVVTGILMLSSPVAADQLAKPHPYTYVTAAATLALRCVPLMAMPPSTLAQSTSELEAMNKSVAEIMEKIDTDKDKSLAVAEVNAFLNQVGVVTLPKTPTPSRP